MSGLIIGFEGTSLPGWVGDYLGSNAIEGVILFKRNFESVEQLLRLTGEIKSAAKFPPIIAIDQEGGRVQRLREPFTVWPSMRKLAAHNDLALARRFGKAVAMEMLAVGVNTIFAPVLCLDYQPGDHIADRSFGKDAAIVGKMGASVIAGMQDAGAIACAKHFPGYGAVQEDSHETMPVVDIPLEKLDKTHLAPFRDAISAGVGMMMVGHLINTAVDPALPSSVSPIWINDILRSRMNCESVVITDDIDMGAISKTMDITETTINAARAGVDLILICHDREKIEEAVEILGKATDDRRQATGIRKEKNEENNLVAMTALRMAGLRKRFLQSLPIISLDVIGCSEHKILAAEIENRS